MWDISAVNWAQILIDIGKTLLISIITAIFAFIFTKKTWKKLTFSEKLKNYGFLQTVTVNDLSEKEKKQIYNKAKEICFIYITANKFLQDEKNKKLIKRALNRGCLIKFLLASPEGEQINDIQNLEALVGFNNRVLGDKANVRKNDIRCESVQVHDIINKINDVSETKINVKYFSSEYRLPMTLAKFDKKDGGEVVKAWLKITLPPYKSEKNFILRGIDDESLDTNSKTNFVKMMEQHYDSIWENSVEWKKEWSEKFNKID